MMLLFTKAVISTPALSIMMNLNLLAILLITHPDCVASTGKARKRASSPYPHAAPAHPVAPIYAQPGGRIIAYDGRHYDVLEPVMMPRTQQPPLMQRRIVAAQGSDDDQILPKENRKIRWADEKGIPLVQASDDQGFLSRGRGRTQAAPAQLKRVNSILKKRDTGVLLSEEEGEVKQPAVKRPETKQAEVKQLREGVGKVTFSLPSQERPKEGGRYVTKINVR
ncbi:hypothetical protein FOL46_004321 [Perkinsus olseni]|uniref:Uncharacterized protein n=1 Tax=Perkinsus olseni TaxID=32597 RepID=A0A7J6LZ97_PEROL|nr:hypothetical protein FOL46_004321 [Perkinsus olseni]